MGFEDKEIQCSDCGTTFIFSAEEQEVFASRGYTNDPKRCPECREVRKTARMQSSGFQQRQQREMYPAICAECGQETQVPFEPRQGRPVYCRDCYNKIKLARQG